MKQHSRHYSLLLLLPWLRLWSASLLLLLATAAQAQPGSWSVNPAAYQYSMTMVAQIRIDGVPNHLPGNQLAAFSNGQIRAYAAPLEFGGQAYYFLNFYSNSYKGDTLYFRAYLGADQKVYESVLDTVIFKHHLALGTVGEPVQIHLHLGDRPVIYTLNDVNFAAGGCTDILDVQSTDKQDSEGNGLTYSIVGGADAALFSIQPQTGLLSWFNFVPDPFMPEDADGNNKYELEVKVTDASNLFDLQKITVTVAPAAPLLALECPGDLFLLSSDDGLGDCGTLSSQTAVPLANPCAVSNLSYQLSGATTDSGSGQIPESQLFAVGYTTVTYTMAGAGGSQCSFALVVNDDEPPTVTCPANLAIVPNIFSPCSATVGGIDAVYSDNCSVPFFSYNLDGATNGSGDGQASGQIFLPGTTTVTYSAIDGSDHYTSCLFTVTVSDCNTQFSGTILWEHDGASGVQDATVNLTGSASGNSLTNANGAYLISFPTYFTGNFTLKPVKNINKLNGVTSADVTAIQLHVTNSAPLPGPFKRIAADVNRNNSITTLDATMLNQAILGNPSALNQITSWRFVPSAYNFPNPSEPWGFPEQINLLGVGGNISGQDFKGIKTGDVVSTWANPADFGNPGTSDLILKVENQVLQAGVELIAEFCARQIDDLNSFQFALYFDPAQLEVAAIEPLAGLPLTMENFGTYNLAEGEIRVAWSQATAVQLENAAQIFRLRFKVLQSGNRLNEVLHRDVKALPAYCYNSAFMESEVVLQFLESTGTSVPVDNQDFYLFQNNPNPFVNETTIGFVLPADGACVAQLRIFDAACRELWCRKNYYLAGYNAETIRLGHLAASRILYYELTTPYGTLTKRLLTGN